MGDFLSARQHLFKAQHILYARCTVMMLGSMEHELRGMQWRQAQGGRCTRTSNELEAAAPSSC